MQASKLQENSSKAKPCQTYIDWFVWPVVLLVSSYLYDTLRQYYIKGQSDGPVDWYHVAFMGVCLALTVGALETTKRKQDGEAKANAK